MIFNDLYLLSYRFIISAYNEAINSNVFFVLNDVQKQKAKNNTREMLAHKWDINNKAFHTVDTEKNQWSSWSFIRQLWSHGIHRKNAHPPDKRVTSVNSSLYLPNDHGRRVVCVSRTSPCSLIAFPLRYTRGGLRNIFDVGELHWIVLAKAIVAPVLPAAVSHRDFRRFRLTQPRYSTKAIWQIRLLRRK